MFERFSDRARRVLVLAQGEAALLNHNFIGTEHLLLGLIDEREGIAAKALAAMGITLDRTRAKVEETIQPLAGASETGSPPFTPRAKKVLELAHRQSLQLGHDQIGTEHLLLGLIQEGEGVAIQVVIDLRVNPLKLRQQVVGLMVGEHAEEQSTSRVKMTSGPTCPQCHLPIPDLLRYHRIEVEPDDREGGEDSLAVDVVFCSRCGTTLGMFRVEG
jgi:ATP-dependent Clp protease ATP-binding subunit ClpC